LAMVDPPSTWLAVAVVAMVAGGADGSSIPVPTIFKWRGTFGKVVGVLLLVAVVALAVAGGF
jgi:hypothetical protein